jgi:hypothetical protein
MTTRWLSEGVREGSDPSDRYASPRDVLRDHSLSEAERRSVLQRWALDAYLIERALPKGDAVRRPSRLDEVIDALIDLDEPEIRLKRSMRGAYAIQRASERSGSTPAGSALSKWPSERPST